MDDIKPGLIVTADDFGYSSSVNRAIEKAARQGILTCASLMMNGGAVQEAVEIARSLPSLGVGLHLNLTEGKPLSPEYPSFLRSQQGDFHPSQPRTGILLQFFSVAQKAIEAEVKAQFEAFFHTGLPFTHVDCHHHFHVHPKLFSLVLQYAQEYKLKTMRIPYEPWEISGSLCPEHKMRNYFYRKVFGILTSSGRKKIEKTPLLSADGVFGLYKTGEITEEWVMQLLDRLDGKKGIFELYTHPADQSCNMEFQALLSQKIREKIQRIQLLRYHEISERKRI